MEPQGQVVLSSFAPSLIILFRLSVFQIGKVDFPAFIRSFRSFTSECGQGSAACLHRAGRFDMSRRRAGAGLWFLQEVRTARKIGEFIRFRISRDRKVAGDGKSEISGFRLGERGESFSLFPHTSQISNGLNHG